MILLILFFVPFTMARLDLAPLVADPIATFCIGEGCPSVSSVDSVRETNFSCNGTSLSLHPDEKDCHSYYRCENGNATKLMCPVGYGFYRLGLTDGYCTLDVYVRACNTIDCTFNGVVPDPAECTRFYVCVHGYPHRFQCPNGTLFNTLAGQCVALPKNIQNPCPKEAISTTTPSSPTTVSSNVTSQEAPLPSEIPSTTQGGSLPVAPHNEQEEPKTTLPSVQSNEV